MATPASTTVDATSTTCRHTGSTLGINTLQSRVTDLEQGTVQIDNNNIPAPSTNTLGDHN